MKGRYAGEITILTPIVGLGVIIVTNGYQRGQPIFAIKPGATGDISSKATRLRIYGDQLYILAINGVLANLTTRSGPPPCGRGRRRPCGRAQ